LVVKLNGAFEGLSTLIKTKISKIKIKVSENFASTEIKLQKLNDEIF
jgi:hypothetical protein